VLDILSLAGILFIINFYTRQTTRLPLSFLPASLLNNHSATLILVFFFFFVIKNAAAYLAYRWLYNFVYAVAGRISSANLFNYLQGSYAKHVHTDSAVQIRKISQQPIEFGHHVLCGLQQMITEVAMVLLATVAILVYNAKLFAILVALLLPVTLLTWLYTRRKINSVKKDIKLTNETSLQYLKEALAGFVESNIYGKNAFFTNRYAKSQQQLNASLAGLQTIQGLPARLMEIFLIMGLLILIAVSMWRGTGHADVITIGAFMAAAYKIIPGLVRVINLTGQLKAYKFTVVDLLQDEGDVHIAIGSSIVTPVDAICFDNISFAYNKSSVLNKVSFKLGKGDFMGIAGPSGRGKTTLVNILLGFLQEADGLVYINGKETNVGARLLYRQRFAYVKQQNFLIHDSIEKNIVLDDDEYDLVKLQTVVEVSGLASLVNQLPDGINTVISENGKNISGGQRQRIAIARALFKDADLIILDEPFNELDNASEIQLLQHFKCLAAQGKMVILITHNQESLAFCNKILKLHE